MCWRRTAPSRPRPSTTILNANGGLSRHIHQVGLTSNLAFLKPSLSYDAATDVFTDAGSTEWRWRRRWWWRRQRAASRPFAGAAQTRNQNAVADALDANAATNPLVLAVLNQTADGARQAFDALSGEVFGSVHNAQAGETQFARSAMLGRMRQASYAGYVGELGALAFGGPELAYAGR